MSMCGSVGGSRGLGGEGFAAVGVAEVDCDVGELDALVGPGGEELEGCGHGEERRVGTFMMGSGWGS